VYVNAPLRPKNPGFLRIVAEPWATVAIDGEYYDATPFAHPIALVPGTHQVRLEHPQAPPESRTVHVSTGETVLVDVKMKVAQPILPDAGEGPLLSRPIDDKSP
jgi:hypothetical protein